MASSFETDTGRFLASLPQDLSTADSPTFVNLTLTGGITAAGPYRQTYDGEAVIPASQATAGFEVTCNYDGIGEVNFWNLVNNSASLQGFAFNQKTAAGTFITIASLYSDTAVTELDFSSPAGTLISFIVDDSDLSRFGTSGADDFSFVTHDTARVTLKKDGTNFNILTDAAQLKPVAFASLPTPAIGMLAVVNNCSTAVWGATANGAGALVVLVTWLGANWTVVGKA